VLEYLPTPQPVHSTDPELALYLPDTQPLQLPFAPDQPALHEQSEILSLCAGEYEFDGHVTHTFFWSAEYDPAVQSLHVSVAEST